MRTLRTVEMIQLGLPVRVVVVGTVEIDLGESMEVLIASPEEDRREVQSIAMVKTTRWCKRLSGTRVLVGIG